MKMKKTEIIIFAVVLAAALICWALMSHKRVSTDHGSIRITVGGKEYGVYSLSENQRIKINDTNTCRILNGEVKMIEATCPDHLCIHQPAVDEHGGFIICLPNEVIIEGLPSAEASTEENAPDMIAG